MDTPSLPAAARTSPTQQFRRLRVVLALVIREMGTKFDRSAGGYIWAIAEPLGGIILLAVVFSFALRAPPLGSNFMLFYATGIIPFSMFTTMSKGVAGSIASNKGLLTYPVVTVLDAVIAKFILNFLTILIVFIILSLIIIVIMGVYVNLNLADLLLAFSLSALLGLGVGTLNCVLFGFFPTWKNVWTVLTKPLFIVSSIFFTYEAMPREFQEILWWNPLVHIVAVMRRGFYGGYEPQFVSYLYVVGLGLGLFVLGGCLLRRHTSSLLER